MAVLQAAPWPMDPLYRFLVHLHDTYVPGVGHTMLARLGVAIHTAVPNCIDFWLRRTDYVRFGVNSFDFTSICLSTAENWCTLGTSAVLTAPRAASASAPATCNHYPRLQYQ
jgi:hypothetical protein